jgi:hypothetical protein
LKSALLKGGWPGTQRVVPSLIVAAERQVVSSTM